jgi:hypothetical protein
MSNESPMADWWRTWTQLWLAPQTLTQSILPGWTWAPALTINQDNSSAPATEVEVVRHHSYGRQLGRIADALAVLIDERGDRPRSTELDEFLEMKREIDRIKHDAAAARVDQLVADLRALRAADPAGYARLRDALRRELDL